MKNLSTAFFVCLVTVSWLFVQPTTSLSAQWQHVATGADGTKLYLDPDSIKVNKEENYINAWIKLLYKDGSYFLAHDRFNYTQKNYLLLKGKQYNRLGQKVGAGKGGSTPEPIVPGSVYDILLNYLLELKGLK
jgi:hypothetical protein